VLRRRACSLVALKPFWSESMCCSWSPSSIETCRRRRGGSPPRGTTDRGRKRKTASSDSHGGGDMCVSFARGRRDMCVRFVPREGGGGGWRGGGFETCRSSCRTRSSRMVLRSPAPPRDPRLFSEAVGWRNSPFSNAYNYKILTARAQPPAPRGQQAAPSRPGRKGSRRGAQRGGCGRGGGRCSALHASSAAARSVTRMWSWRSSRIISCTEGGTRRVQLVREEGRDVSN
jgi:hypothetical protein